MMAKHSWSVLKGTIGELMLIQTSITGLPNLLLIPSPRIMTSVLPSTNDTWWLWGSSWERHQENYADSRDPDGSVCHVPCRDSGSPLCWEQDVDTSLSWKRVGRWSVSPRKHLGSRILGDGSLTGNNQAANLTGTVYRKHWHVLCCWPQVQVSTVHLPSTSLILSLRDGIRVCQDRKHWGMGTGRKDSLCNGKVLIFRDLFFLANEWTLAPQNAPGELLSHGWQAQKGDCSEA